MAVLANHKHSSYLYRMTSLYSMTALAPVVGPEVLTNTMLPLVLQLGMDPVPNVRFNVAKCLRQLVPLLDPSTVQGQVKPCLTTMATDTDQDVSYFASQALQSC